MTDLRSPLLRRVVGALPHGFALPPEAWAARHRVILVVLWLHAAAIAVLGTAVAGPHAILEALPVAGAAVLAGRPRLRPSWRGAIATAGLFTASAAGIHLSGGYIEAHFHFFVMVGLITLYQDWVPFVIALGSTVLHHASLGVVAPDSVYNHPAAIERPVLWAGIHGGFVLAAATPHLCSWRLSEERFRDAVTRLPNRALLESRLQRIVAKPDGNEGGASVLVIDLDEFKAVNDGLGHAAGDELLRAAGQRIAGCLRSGDVLARLGGDEFAVLIPTSEAAITQAVADRIVTALARPFVVGGSQMRIGSSVGIETWDGSQSAEQLLRNADTAMYAAKRGGKGRSCQFDVTMDDTRLDRLAVRTELEAALHAGQLTVHYQPVTAIDTGTVAAVEALVRWDHPARGLLPPSEFLPYAEGTWLIAAIDRWVLEQACRQVCRWNLEKNRGDAAPLRVSVNISAYHLLMDDFFEQLEVILSGSRLEPQLLVLEVTETVLVTDLERASAVLDRVRALGIRVAIDDFGTGHSSLRYLQELPIDVLKIDRSFIAPLGFAPEHEAVARAISQLGQSLGLTVVAEGVETPLQLARLADMGCGLAQGYFFGRPLDPSAMESHLHQHRLEAPDGGIATRWRISRTRMADREPPMASS